MSSGTPDTESQANLFVHPVSQNAIAVDVASDRNVERRLAVVLEDAGPLDVERQLHFQVGLDLVAAIVGARAVVQIRPRRDLNRVPKLKPLSSVFERV